MASGIPPIVSYYGESNCSPGKSRSPLRRKMSLTPRGMCQRMDRWRNRELARIADKASWFSSASSPDRHGLRLDRHPLSQSLISWFSLSISIDLHASTRAVTIGVCRSRVSPHQGNPSGPSFAPFRPQIRPSPTHHPMKWRRGDNRAVQKLQSRPYLDFVQPEFSATRPPILR